MCGVLYSKATKIGAIAILYVPLLAGCESSSQRRHEALVLQTSRLDRQEYQLGFAYMNGDVSQARAAIQERIQAYKASQDTLAPGGLDDVLRLEYFRLYALETRAGNPAAAEVALIKARYWLTCALEAEKLPADEIMEKIKSYNTTKIEDIVNRLDKGASGGRLPKYLKYIRQSSNGVHQ